MSPADSATAVLSAFELLSSTTMAGMIFVRKVKRDAASNQTCTSRSQQRRHLDLLKGKAVANAHARPSAEWHPGAHLGRPPLLIQPPAHCRTLLADTFVSLDTDENLCSTHLTVLLRNLRVMQLVPSLSMIHRHGHKLPRGAGPLEHQTRCNRELWSTAPALQWLKGCEQKSPAQLRICQA